MDKVERIACLYLSFLNSPQGLSFSKLREAMPLAYQGKFASARRKFERDKEDLKILGLELDCRGLGENGDNYLYIPKEEIAFLPELDLTQEEYQAVASFLFDALVDLQYDKKEKEIIYSISQKVFYQNSFSLQKSLDMIENAFSNFTSETNKISQGAKINSANELVYASQEGLKKKHTLEVIYKALKKKKVLEIEYLLQDRPTNLKNSQKRKKRFVSGRGLLAHRGSWCLLAYCHEAKGIRYFYTNRIESIALALDKNYKADPYFQICKYSLHPLCLFFHEAIEVKIQIQEDYLEKFTRFTQALDKMSEKKIVKEVENIFIFETYNKYALFDWILSQVDAVERLGPNSLQKDFCLYYKEIKDFYQ